MRERDVAPVQPRPWHSRVRRLGPGGRCGADADQGPNCIDGPCGSLCATASGLPVDVEGAEGTAHAQPILVDVETTRCAIIAELAALAVEVDVRFAGLVLGLSGIAGWGRRCRGWRLWGWRRGGGRSGRGGACRDRAGWGRRVGTCGRYRPYAGRF